MEFACLYLCSNNKNSSPQGVFSTHRRPLSAFYLVDHHEQSGSQELLGVQNSVCGSALGQIGSVFILDSPEQSVAAD